MRVIVFTSLLNAQSARNLLDTKLGFPKAGANVATGATAAPGGSGWTLTCFAVVSVTDTNGVYGPAGTVYYLLGPIPAWLETRILAVAPSTTIVTVPASLLAKGTRYEPSISGWSNSLPAMTENPTTFDSKTAP